MKLTLEADGHKTSIEADGSGQDLAEMCRYFSQLLRGAGYIFNGEVVISEEDND